MDKMAFDLLVPPAEAVKLAGFRTIADLEIARDIEKAFVRAGKMQRMRTDSTWIKYCLLGTIWNAGRIQGVREERARRKNK